MPNLLADGPDKTGTGRRPAVAGSQKGSIRVLGGLDLPAELIERWDRIQRTEPTLDSPFFRPEFTHAVARARGGVEVAVIERGGEPIAFFPYERRGHTAYPVGGRLSNFQGVVAPAGLDWSPVELLRACGLRAWTFDHLITSQQPMRSHHWLVVSSPFAELSGGFDAYCRRVEARNGKAVARTLYRIRKLERNVGPVRFEFDSPSREVYDQLRRWKTDQYRRTGLVDVFSHGWTEEVFMSVLAESGPDFAGCLSALYAGDTLAAVHLGLHTSRVLHWWYPTYNPALAAYSPGLVLLLECLRYACDRGWKRLDFGKDTNEMKRRFMTGDAPVAEGRVDRVWSSRTVRRNFLRTRELIRSSPFRGPVGRVVRKLRFWMAG